MIYRTIHSLQNLWARHKALVIINGFFIIAAIFFLIPYLTPNPPLDVTQPDMTGIEPTVRNMSIEMLMETPNVPSELPLYRLDQNSVQNEKIFHDVGTRLGITTALDDTYLTNQNNDDLFWDTEKNWIHYTRGETTTFPEESSSVTALNTEPLNLQDAQMKAEAWLQIVGFTDIQADNLDVRYYRNDDRLEGMTETDPNQANIIRFSFSRRLENFDIVYGSSTAERASIVVTHDGVTQANFPAFLATFSRDQNKPLLPFATVLENISAGKYLFADVIAAVSQDSSQVEPVKFMINEARIVYRVDTAQNAAIPYWNLTGETQLRNGQVVPLEITTPAIEL